MLALWGFLILCSIRSPSCTSLWGPRDIAKLLGAHIMLSRTAYGLCSIPCAYQNDSIQEVNFLIEGVIFSRTLEAVRRRRRDRTSGGEEIGISH